VGSGAASRATGFGKAGTRTAAQATAAKAEASARVAAASLAIRCFTDGACTGNPGPCGAGLVVKFPDGRVIEKHRALGVGTNNIGELSAIGMALEALDEAGVSAESEVVVFSDSQYARGVLTQGWKAKANVELITKLRAHLRTRPGVRLEWVAGHVGLAENERADALAGRGVDESRRR
jgi:ribonuclease HI